MTSLLLHFYFHLCLAIAEMRPTTNACVEALTSYVIVFGYGAFGMQLDLNDGDSAILIMGVVPF